jgi:hypothetical protein
VATELPELAAFLEQAAKRQVAARFVMWVPFAGGEPAL